MKRSSTQIFLHRATGVLPHLVRCGAPLSQRIVFDKPRVLIARMRDFIVRVSPRELRGFDADRDAALIKGVHVRAFTPGGAALKAYRLRLIPERLKDYIVESGSQTWELYPIPYSAATFLDAPLDTLLHFLS